MTTVLHRPRPLLVVAILIVAAGSVGFVASAVLATPRAQSDGPAVSPNDAIRQIDEVRASIDETLALIKEGRAQEAFEAAKDGYLSHFELVEIPLRIVDPQLTADAETKFAEIRGLITTGAPVGEVRANIVELRTMLNGVERKLTDEGIGAPALVATQSFAIIFREGLEAVLLVSILLGYLEAAKATQYRRPILLGMGVAVLATVVTFLAMRLLLNALPVGREVLEAITALLAVVVLFYVSFWLIARLEQKRWLEFLRARIWTAVSLGSTAALVLVGFTAIYREGFETALFYQALLSFGPGLGVWIALGLVAGVVALAAVAFAIFRLGRRLPIKALLTTAVVFLMVTSVILLGNAIRALQEADIIAMHRWADWPRAPIFLAQSLGYWPSRETLTGQGILIGIYLAGAAYMFLVRPRLRRSAEETNPGTPVPEVRSATETPSLVDEHR
jgi:high-affinity iron transporter